MKITSRAFANDGRGSIYWMTPADDDTIDSFRHRMRLWAKANETTAGFGIKITIDGSLFYEGPLNEIIALGLAEKIKEENKNV